MKALKFLPLFAVLPVSADIAWIDIDDPNAPTAIFHSSLQASDGATTTWNGLTFTLLGSSIDKRNRSTGDDLLKDFAFAPEIVLRIDGLPAGTYTVESWHYDGDGYTGAVDIAFREQGQVGTTLVSNFVFFRIHPPLQPVIKSRPMALPVMSWSSRILQVPRI